MKIYYAHSIGIYDSLQEQRDIKLLTDLGFEVVNPNTDAIREGIAAYKLEHPDRDYMEYFRHILDSCDLLAFRALSDSKIGSGVWYEIQYMRLNAKAIIELPNLFEHRALSVFDTREHLRVVGNR